MVTRACARPSGSPNLSSQELPRPPPKTSLPRAHQPRSSLITSTRGSGRECRRGGGGRPLSPEWEQDPAPSQPCLPGKARSQGQEGSGDGSESRQLPAPQSFSSPFQCRIPSAHANTASFGNNVRATGHLVDQGAESALLEEKETEAQEVKPTRSTSQSQFISELRLEARSPDSSPGSFSPKSSSSPGTLVL